MESDPESINDYKIISQIGEGAYARVFLVTSPSNSHFALKMIKTDNLDKDDIRTEAVMLASVRHPNLLWAREFFYYSQERYFIIVTDYCELGSLDQHFAGLDVGQLRGVFEGIANGLRYLHIQRHILHRDLKLENI